MALLHDTIALTQAAFNKLPEYSTSTPTGVWPGKQWKCKCKGKDNWWMLEFYEEPGDTKYMYTRAKKIVIRAAGVRASEILGTEAWADRNHEWKKKQKEVRDELQKQDR